jgi:hypothetical protein
VSAFDDRIVSRIRYGLMLHYILDDLGNAQPCEDLGRWARFMDAPHARTLGDDTIDDARVSTGFLGLDHNHTLSGPPVLWETMIFGGAHDSWQARYTSKLDAIVGHHAVLAWVQGHGPEP